MKTLGNIVAFGMVLGILVSVISEPLILLALAVVAAIAWQFRTREKHFPPRDL